MNKDSSSTRRIFRKNRRTPKIDLKDAEIKKIQKYLKELQKRETF